MIRSIITQLNKENMLQLFAPQTLAPKSHITFFDRKESYTKKLSERNSIRTKIVTLDLSPTNSRCSNNVGLFAVSRTFLAHSVMLGGVNASRMVQFKRLSSPVIARRQKPADEAIQPILDVRRTGEGETLPGGVIW